VLLSGIVGIETCVNSYSLPSIHEHFVCLVVSLCGACAMSRFGYDKPDNSDSFLLFKSSKPSIFSKSTFWRSFSIGVKKDGPPVDVPPE
jgi:hypothetical protein